MRATRWKLLLGGGAVLLALGAMFGKTAGRSAVMAIHQAGTRKKTVAQRVAEFGAAVDGRPAVEFSRCGVTYPPARVALIGLKAERVLEVHAAGADGQFRFIKAYPIHAASGTTGPKLREGDGQMPEGIYRIDSLNPNSLFHLSLRVGYPNEFDRAQARRDGRTNLGGDIMIHGGAASVGCLAMGDTAAEDLFVLAARTDIQNIMVILSPVDFRVRRLSTLRPTQPPWVDGLYGDIQEALKAYPRQS